MSVTKLPRMNQTGMTAAPAESKALLEIVPRHPEPPTEADQAPLIAMRRDYVMKAEPVGSVPAPVAIKGKAKASRAAADEPTILMDKLGERLAFERAGVRLYDAMIHKVRAGARGGPVSMDDLQHIRDEELDHFHLVHQAIEELGGDPTAVTPAADVVGVMGMGILQVLADPRTSTDQCLCALLTAELADHDGWELLIQLTRGLGHAELATRFETARTHEEEHLTQVRGWLTTMSASAAGIS
jgi:ferritin-like protein